MVWTWPTVMFSNFPRRAGSVSSPGSLNSATASPWPFALSHTKWAFAIAVARTSIAE